MFRYIIAFATALALCGPVAAQSPLTPVSINVTRYDTLPDQLPDHGMACCAPAMFESGPDVDFFYLDLDFNVAWSDDLDRVSVTSRDMLLQFPDEEEGLRPFARISFLPVVELSGRSISARRSRDWPDETTQAFMNNLWMVPAGTTSANLVIGEEGEQLEILLNLDIPVSQMLQPLETVSVTLYQLSIAEPLLRTRRITGGEIIQTVAATNGQLMQLDVSMTPRMSTETDADIGDNKFYFFNTYFSLLGPDGIPLAPLGQDVSGSLINDYSNSITWEDTPPVVDRTFYFIGAGTPGNYQVYYLSDLVGQINLQ